MRIVLTAPIEEPVPPIKYGGTELVVYNLCQEMVKKGHEVFLLASGDSQTDAELVPLVPKSLRHAYSVEEIDEWRQMMKVHQLATVLKEIQRLRPDVVYNHQGWRFAPFIQFVECPVFTTIHGPLASANERMTFMEYPEVPLISISNNQRLALPDANWAKTIYNGIQLDKFEVGPSERDYFAFLGRTSPEKGLKQICEMVKKTSHKLKIAAKVDIVDKAYFEREILPLIDGKQIEFVGEVGPEEKKVFLQNAKALLLWLTWEEPFGLVVVEALASGTPVIVNPRGSMPELMIDGKTGFLVSTLDEMAAAMEKITQISASDCRKHCEQHFSAQKMTKAYLELAFHKGSKK